MILMRYLIRSLKTFLYFLAIFIIIVAVVVLSGMEEFDIDSLFRDGYKSLVQIFIVLALIAAVYPKVSYAKLFPRINGNLSGNRIQITGLMEEFGYVVENDIVASQTEGQVSRPDYVHHYVARRLLSEGHLERQRVGALQRV